MNRAPLIFLGIFVTLAFSWTGIVLTNQIAYGKLEPVYDDNEGKSFPQALPGIAAQGKLVYQDLGCIYCHTQQVRRPGYGGDIDRGWGERQSVARDYFFTLPKTDRAISNGARARERIEEEGEEVATLAGCCARCSA